MAAAVPRCDCVLDKYAVAISTNSTNIADTNTKALPRRHWHVKNFTVDGADEETEDVECECIGFALFPIGNVSCEKCVFNTCWRVNDFILYPPLVVPPQIERHALAKAPIWDRAM